MTTATATAPAVLFRIPDDRNLPLKLRGFQLLDVPEDTQAALRAWEVAKQLDEEAGAAVRYSLGEGQDRTGRAYAMGQARKVAKLSAELHAVLRDLDGRWSGKDQKPPAAT